MGFFVFHLPVAVVGEEGIRLCRDVVHLGQTQTVSQRQRLLIDPCTTYDVDVLVGPATRQGSVQRGVDITAGQLLDCCGQHHIATVGQGTLGQRQVGVASHDDGMACGQRLEAFQVVGQPVDEFVLESDGAVLRHRSYYTNHTLTSALM